MNEMAIRAAEDLKRNALTSIAQHCRELGLSLLDHSIWLAVFPFRLDVMTPAESGGH
jgi:hypothetical protein